MRILLGSDEWHAVDEVILAELQALGHTVVPFGALLDRRDHAWADLAHTVAAQVGHSADEAVLLCWTGTGVSIAANRLPGVRAALCTDAQTAAGARLWNHANVLCLAHRTLTPDLAREILAAWFAPFDADVGAAGVAALSGAAVR